MISWIIYAVIGKLLIYFWQKFPLPEKIEKTKIGQLHSCGICSGFWIYTALAFLLNVDLLQAWFGFTPMLVLSEIITGCITSYLIHLLSLGFAEQHLNVTIM
jgi:hypothetical protein